MTLMTGLLLLCGLAAQAKMVVNYPTVASKPYTGSEQTPVVPESPEYYVLMASAGTGVGEYAIYLALTDSENTKWPDTDEEVGTMKWQITKAANAWTTEPSIASWTYGDPASTPTAVAKFGTPTVTFSGTAKDGTTYADVTSVAKAGTYSCKFTVAGTENYEGLDPVVRDFEIKVAVPGGGGGGSGNVNISVTGYDGPYDGSDHQIVVSITGEDAPTFSVGYSDAQNGPFQLMNSFKYKEIGTHTVWYCLQSANYATVTNSAVIKISQREINPPVVVPKAYNGGPQSADVSETADYSVEYNGAFTDAGTHENAVILALKDSVHCKWANGAEDPVLLSFTITKSSGNAWMTEPSISGWKYGESAHVPVAVPKYGVVSVLYDGTTTDGQKITDATSVSKAGRYKAKFSVPETVSYNGLSANVEFAIERGTIDIGGGGTGGATLEVSNYSGTYDGDAHTASIAVTGDALSSFDLAYSLVEAGVYSPDKPTFSNACETTKIWYTVSSPDYQTVTNFATVAIGRRPVTFTSGSLSKKYDATPLVCSPVTVSGTFAKSEGFSFETTGSQTDVGTSKNTFSYSPKAGTLASNYAITKTEGDLEVTKRSVTLTSATASKKFDDAPLVAKTVSVTGDGWAGKESATYDVTGTQTTVGATQNTFTYALTNGAKEWNYTIAKVEGILTVTQGDVVYTAQGYTAEYDGNGHSIAVNVTTPGGLVPKYALMPEGPYSATLPTFTNVCTDVVVWYALEADQYASVTNSATVTIAKRPLTAAMVNAIADQTYTGSEIKPPLTFTDAGNRMIAAEDYTATYSDNTVAGTASVKITGKRNYAGEVTVTFKIVKANYDMSGAKWNYTTAFTYDKTEKSVSVTGLPAGVTVKAIADGRKTHAGDYVAKVSFNYDADNYNEPKLADCSWKINRKTLAVTADAKTQTFGKAELPLTYKAPALCAGDALSGSLARDPGTNVGKYVIRQGTLAHADYTITFTGSTYEIVKAAINSGDEPGSGSVPAGGVSKFDAVAMYDGEGHTIKTNELVAAFKATIGNDFAVSYAMSESGGQGLSSLPPTDASAWMTVAPDFTNVCETSVWYKVTSANYLDFVHKARVTVMPRDISNVTISDIPDQQHTGGAINPNVVVTDGNPSIISSADYDVGYSDNVNVGTATVTLMGKRNYSGTKMATFKIVSGTAVLQAEIAWKLLKASGTYMAQLKVTCTSGLSTGITNLRFMFADRVSGGTTYASLWDTPKRAAKSTTMPYSGDTYRYVALDASRITAENVAVTYGVRSLAATSIPTAERTIELYVRKRVNPTTGKEEAAGVDNFVGYVSWTSGGETSYLPVVAGAQAVSLAKAALRAPAPMRLAAVNTALAVGSVIAEGSSPYCKLTEFAVGDSEISGVVEVGSVSGDGTEYPGKLGPNATVTLLGTNDLGLDFKEICSVTTDSAGRFRLVQPKDCQFFKLKLAVEEVVE